MENNNNTPQIYIAMSNILKDISFVEKNQKNKFYNFSYRGIDDVYNAINPLMAKHQVFVTPTVLEREIREGETQKKEAITSVVLLVKYTFYTFDGSFVDCTVCGEGADKGDKGTSKAMAMAHKYALLQTFCIPTEEVKDGDADTVEVASYNKTTNKMLIELAKKGNYISEEDKKLLIAFINTSAELKNIKTEELLHACLNHFDNFNEAFKNWIKTNKKEVAAPTNNTKEKIAETEQEKLLFKVKEKLAFFSYPLEVPVALVKTMNTKDLTVLSIEQLSHILEYINKKNS